jgi:gliding motility-associated-like protein
MRRSNRLPFGLCIAFFLFAFGNGLRAQSITYQNPSEFFACDEASFSFTVQNTTGAALTGVTVTVNFTTTLGTPCGIEYVQGSVSGGVVEGSLSNLSAPQFLLPNLAPGASQTFTISASANCQTAACIDNAEVFVNNISLNWAGGSTSVTTNPYVIDRALLIFTNVTSTVMQGTRGDVLHRKFTIRNTRPGALSSFVFTDVYQPGISITSAQGTPLPGGPGTFSIQLGSTDFFAIGDGDALFEFNETIVITEDIEITTCGLDEQSSVSNISAAWGCNGAQCQAETANAVVTFKLYTKAPQLAWEPIITVPECFCGPNGHEQGMKITNVGNGAALDIILHIGQTLEYLSASISTASIHVDSLNTPIGFELSTGTANAFTAPCVGPGDLIEGFAVTIAKLAPGASVIVHWDNYYCQRECIQPNAGWEYTYSYFKECPPNIFIQNNKPIVVGETGLLLNTHAQFDADSALVDGHQYTVLYEVNYDSLSLLEDDLTVEITLPCGLEWVPTNEMLLNGQAPISITIDDSDTAHLVITAVYALPLTMNTGTIAFDVIFHCEDICMNQQVCNYELETSCTELCPGGFEPSIGGVIQTTISKCPEYPLDCNIQSCIAFQSSYDCQVDSVCVDSPPGYLSYNFTALRKNYGLPDNNNDRIPDALTGLPNLNLVARQRFIPGDTIQATFRGAVVIDVPGKTLPFGLLQVGFFGGGKMRTETRVDLMTPDHLPEVGSLLRIWDKSTGNWYNCPNPPHTTDALIRYNYDLDKAFASCLPPNFSLDNGDSLIFVGNYRIGFNPKPEVDPEPLLGDIVVEPRVLLWDADSTSYSINNCKCEVEQLELSYYEYVIIPGTFGLPPCSPSTPTTASLLRLQLHQGNFFPFEHRNLMVAENLLITTPPTVEICSTRMVVMRLQDGNQIASQVIFPPNLVNGQYVHNLLQFQNPPLDEGFSATFQHVFKSECTNKFSMPMEQVANLNFAPGLPEAEDPLAYTVNSNALRPLIPNLAIDAPLFNLISFSNQLLFDFKLKNTPTVVGTQSSGPAPNTWLYITSQTGLVTNFQLINQTTGQPVPMTNGIWQLGDLAENPAGFPYRLLALNNSCDVENLQIHYGWNCAPYLNSVQTPCYEQVQPLSIESPPGEIDMIVTSPSGCYQLCDTIPYHEIEVFNAQLGSVYNLHVKALVPPGFQVIPGSCQVEYPTGSNQFYPIGDPTALGTGIFDWNLSMLFDSISAGLPGVGEAPLNSLTLRFLGETTCDFVADAYSLFIAAAEQNCGTPTNTIAKPGDPICIEGVSNTYTMNINVDAVPGFGCNDVTQFQASLSPSDVLPAGACLIVTLPPGISYVPNSCESTCVAGLNCNPAIDGSLLTWQLPAGVLPSQLICLHFSTQGWGAFGCENGVVLFRSAAQTQAICALTGDSCSTKVSTGSLIFPYNVQRPNYDLSNFHINAVAAGGNDQVLFNVDVTNNGADNQPPLAIDFFLDNDGNGTGDQLVHTESYTSLVGAGQTVTVMGSFLLPAGANLCALVAVIDPTDQCACAGDQIQVASPISYETGLAWTVCSGVDQEIGVTPIPGYNYQWTPDDCIANAQAPMTVFNCVNDDINPVTYQFSLAEGNGFCEIQNLMEVTVQPVAGIAYADSPICQGQSANLAATDGATFLWQGPGIAQPNLQIITVTPSATSQYSVTVTDAFGCMGTDEVTVVVVPLPVANAGADQTVCPGEVAHLNASMNANYDFNWSPQLVNGQPALSNANIPNPVVLTNQTTTFTLQVYDGNCSATDDVTISFLDSVGLVMPPDVTICLGNSTTLTATTTVPAAFTWSPDGNCLNPPSCSSLLVSPTSTTTYTASVATSDGCTATGTVTVTVVTDQMVENGPPVSICEGETATIFGQVVSQPGVYCDTFQIAGGCDSLYCVQLLVKPAIDTISLDTAVCLGESVVFEGQEFSDPGLHCVTFVGQNGCDSTRCLNLSVLPLPTVELTVSVDTVGVGDTVFLSIPPGNYADIQWLANDSLLTGCAGSTTCFHIPLDSVVYAVFVLDENGCRGTDQQAVVVIPNCNPELVEVPNAFSPNGDKINDEFNIVSLGSEVVENMKIWNRWGQKVYDGTGPWNGEQGGKPAASDVYIYLIKVGCAITSEDMGKVLKGDVTLLR